MLHGGNAAFLPVGEAGVEREKPMHRMKGILCVSSRVLLVSGAAWCVCSTDEFCKHLERALG